MVIIVDASEIVGEFLDVTGAFCPLCRAEVYSLCARLDEPESGDPAYCLSCGLVSVWEVWPDEKGRTPGARNGVVLGPKAVISCCFPLWLPLQEYLVAP